MSDGEVPPLPRLSARLQLGESPFDPAAISARVGLEPTQTRRLGDLARPGTRSKLRMRSDEWLIRVEPRDALDINELLVELRAALQPSWERLVSECAKGDLRPMVCCVVWSTPEQQPIIHLSPRTLSWINELDAVLDIDLYSLPAT